MDKKKGHLNATSHVTSYANDLISNNMTPRLKNILEAKGKGAG
jgi:hypothetical protein